MEKRTTIFSIFVFLCLLTNSTYARTTEYENPRDTILDMMLYFDLKARQADKDYQGNGKTLATLDSLLAHPARSRHLYSIILVSPDSYNGKKEPDIAPGLKRSEEVKAFLCRKYPQVNAAQICIRTGEEYGDALRKLITDDRLVPDREDVLALIDYHHDNPVKMQRFLATSGCRHTLSIYFQPAATGAQTDKNKSLPVLSGRKGRKKLLHGTGGHDRRN